MTIREAFEELKQALELEYENLDAQYEDKLDTEMDDDIERFFDKLEHAIRAFSYCIEDKCILDKNWKPLEGAGVDKEYEDWLDDNHEDSDERYEYWIAGELDQYRRETL